MGEFYHLKKSGLGLHAPSIACQRGFEPIKGIGEADFGQWVVKIPRADSSQQWKTAFHSGMSTSLKRGYEAFTRNLKSAITYEIWKTTSHIARIETSDYIDINLQQSLISAPVKISIELTRDGAMVEISCSFVSSLCFLFLTSKLDCFDQEKLVAHPLLYL